MIAEIKTRFGTSPEIVWQEVKNPKTLTYIAGGMMGFAGADKFPHIWKEGQEIETSLILFHILPAWWKHYLKVVRVDNERMEILSNERSGFIRTWNHWIKIDRSADGKALYTDRIEIEAGMMTLPVWFFANMFYRYRQMRWRKLLRSLKGEC
jgi:hypothetical protein